MKHRILFYSHDTFGLGHFRRSLTVATHLTRHVESVAVLMLTGLDSAAAFEPAAGIDFVKLPGVWKSGREEYRSRHLKVSFQRVRRIRRELVRGVVRAFDPHLLIVDNSPRGVGGELLSTLRYLRERRPETRIALTMRDVIDRPDHVNTHWQKVGMLEVLDEYYDEIWIAGARAVFDLPDLYGFPESLRKRTRYCGYVVRSSSPADVDRVRRELHMDERPRVLVSCGGGGDGYELMDAWAQVAMNFARDGIDSIVLLGPDMSLAQRRELRSRLLPLGERAVVFDFSPDFPALLAASTVSVSMAGYNTVCEVVSTGKPALIVPRIAPRDEQWLRAKALQGLDLVSVLRPDALTPATLEDGVRKLIARAAGGWAPELPDGLDFAGAARIARRVRKNLSLPAAEDDAA